MNLQLIIVKLKGGLGNQMFQYAIGKHLSLKRKCPLRLDLLYMKYDRRKKYELDKLNIENKKTYFLEEVFYYFINFFHRIIPFYKFIKQKSRKFNSSILNSHTPILYLDGYWQSEKYFEAISEIIKKEFRITARLNEENKKMLNKIQNCNAVVIHLRRRDYICDAQINKKLGTCSMNYYKQAIKLIENKVEFPKYFIFSDDIEWVKENFELINNPIFVDINTYENGYDDLRLMKNCKHFILANSTFSWWAAWLSENKHKVIIAPRNWIQSQSDGCIVPESWIRI
ncbi:MAG: alpha-1,2-fucosyltransferase [Candidatus Lokiarchaeota archaeon]|nr:alpha-1,2-fucosyltransferase [Candidatus Lokiarchaeota archaeon]